MPRALNNLRDVVLKAFKDSLTHIEVLVPNGANEVARLVVRAGGTRYEFQLIRAGQGWPSDVRALLENLPKKWPRNFVMTAHRFSDGALKLLRDRGANWIDSAGHVRVEAPPALLIERSPASVRVFPSPGFNWSPSSVDLAEYLLTKPMERIRVHTLARETGWSAGQVVSVLTRFDKMNWTRRQGPSRGRSVWRELAKPGVLLEAWAEHLSRQRYPTRMGHALMRDPLVFAEEKLQPVLGKEDKWALTGWAAAHILAPYSTIIPMLSLYVPETYLYGDRFESIADSTGLRLVEEGGNLEFRGAAAEPFKYVQLKGLPLVSTPRVYADLMYLGGRAEDAAKHFRETLLGY